MKQRFNVFDSVGKYVQSFPTREQAYTFRLIRGREDWKIKIRN